MDFDLADNILLGGQPVNAVYKGTTLVWPFTPERLFRSSEQGVWYDPSDIDLTWRRNLLTYSQEFNNAAWSKTGVTVTANASAAPDGTTTAETVTEATTTTQHYINLTTSFVSGLVYTQSVFAKAGTVGVVQMIFNSTVFGLYAWANYDLTSGVLGTVGSAATATITSVGSGWYRITLTATCTTSGSQTSGLIVLCENNVSATRFPVYTGNAANNIYVWGAQLEAGSTATAYQRITDGVQDYLTYDTQPVMFQDAAGTIPVTAVEQPVGRILDKSGRGNHAFQSTSSSRPVLSARVNRLLATETLATQSVTTLATQYTLRFTGAGSITLSGKATGTYIAGTHTITCTAGTLTLTVSGTVTQADLREANINYDLPSYQRVNTATDYDTVGFKPYLKFDGSDDFLVTNNIDFTSTGRVGVFAGLRKLSDSGAGNVVELSTATDTNNGSFAVTAPDGASATFAFKSKGTVLANSTVGGVAAPVTGLFTGIGNIAGDNATVRFNGLEISTLSDQGTGNYGNYPLYIGRSGGTTLPFNGHIYSLVIRGAQTINSTLEKVERYVNQKTNALDWEEVGETAAFRWNSATASPDAE